MRLHSKSEVVYFCLFITSDVQKSPITTMSNAHCCSTEAQVTTTELSVSVRQLQACESYVFDVAVVGPLGAGPLSGRVQSLVTQFNTFSAPKNLRVERDPTNELNVTLTWSASCPSLDAKVGYRVSQ